MLQLREVESQQAGINAWLVKCRLCSFCISPCSMCGMLASKLQRHEELYKSTQTSRRLYQEATLWLGLRSVDSLQPRLGVCEALLDFAIFISSGLPGRLPVP